MRLIEFDKNKGEYKVLLDHVHLKDTSPLVSAHQQIFRGVQAERLRLLESAEKLEVMVTYSGTEETQAKIKAELQNSLRRIEALVKSAPAEKVYQLNLAAFPWEFET